MHEEVVRAVHRVHIAEQGQDLTVRAAGSVDRVRLIAPQRRAAKPVAADRQLGEHGYDDDQPGTRPEP